MTRLFNPTLTWNVFVWDIHIRSRPHKLRAADSQEQPQESFPKSIKSDWERGKKRDRLSVGKQSFVWPKESVFGSKELKMAGLLNMLVYQRKKTRDNKEAEKKE